MNQETFKVPLPPLPQWDTPVKSYEPAPFLMPPAAPPMPTAQQIQQAELQRAIALLEQFQQQQSPLAAQQSLIAPRQQDRLPLMIFGGLIGSITMVACTAVIANSLPNAQMSATQRSQLQMMEQMAKRQPTVVCIAFSCPPPVVQSQPVQYVPPAESYPVEVLSVGTPVQ